MAIRFFDTSAIAKHYQTEIGTDVVDAFLIETFSKHLISALSVVELHSVFARLVRTSQITTSDFQMVRGRFLADIAIGMWQIVGMRDVHFNHAQQLLMRHGIIRSLRTLDSLQLAVALLIPGGTTRYLCVR